MYTEHIAYQARRLPDAIAVALTSGNVSYERFDADINRVAHRLRVLLPSQARVALWIANHYLHWLVILALGRLEHVSVSTLSKERISLLASEIVLTDHSVTTDDPPHFIELSRSWVAETLKADNRSPLGRRSGARDPARIVTSSGTTGTPKKMLFSHELVVRRMRNGPFGHTLHCERKGLCAIGLGTSTGFILPLRIWWFGGTVCLLPLSYETLLSHHVSGITLSVGQLSHFVQNLPADFAPLPHLTVNVAGSALPLRLFEETRRRLTPRLIEGYGSNEAGCIAWCPAAVREEQPDVTGFVVPGVTVQIVDEQGIVLPPGATGEVRVRSDEMVNGYLEDDAATARAFRDEWFYPGDLGSLSKRGALKILGRVDEVMNLSGLKLAPDAVEQTLSSCKGIEDVGAFSMTNEWGAEEPWIAVVKGHGFDEQEIVEALKKAPKTKYHLVYVSTVPRNELGKIERNQLKESVRKSRQARSGKIGASNQSP